MVLWVKRGDDASRRLGVVSSKKVGNAVKRNRARRRLRSVWRLNRYKIINDVDVVLIARKNVVSVPWKQIEEEFFMLLQKSGIYKSDTE